MMFRHMTSYYDITGPHDLPRVRNFTSLKPHAFIPMKFPFPIFSTFSTAI